MSRHEQNPDVAAREPIDRLVELPAASSLLSVAWSRDNLVTSHPGRLYDGRIQQMVSRQSLTFNTFEAYMDAALHDPHWGYYGHGVSIGRRGHFNTHPESLSPHFGRWIANWAFNAWRDMLQHAELSEGDAFPIIEFGAGNGRLARDFLDSITQRAQQLGHAQQQWQLSSRQVLTRLEPPDAPVRAGHQQQEGAPDDTPPTALPDGSSPPVRSQATRRGATRSPLTGHQQPALITSKEHCRARPCHASAATPSDLVSAAA